MSGWTRRRALRRWLFTRCEGCGGRFKRGQGVVNRGVMHPTTTRQIILGEVGRYHFDCSPPPEVEHAVGERYDREWAHDRWCRVNVLGEPEWMAAELSVLAQARKDAETAYLYRLVDLRTKDGKPFAWAHGPRRTSRDLRDSTDPADGAEGQE